MQKITADGVTFLVTEEQYKADFFGKVTHTNHGWVPADDESAPVFPAADATIFGESSDSPEVPENPETQGTPELPENPETQGTPELPEN